VKAVLWFVLQIAEQLQTRDKGILRRRGKGHAVQQVSVTYELFN